MNKITREFIEHKIKDIKYIYPEGTTLTICIIKLDNGFTVFGKSSCVDLNNYDKNVGDDIAYNNAFDKLWEPVGYHLKEQIFQANKDNDGL